MIFTIGMDMYTVYLYTLENYIFMFGLEIINLIVFFVDVNQLSSQWHKLHSDYRIPEQSFSIYKYSFPYRMWSDHFSR